jgi:RimJ/RimL family protein N-acetyltransferase
LPGKDILVTELIYGRDHDVIKWVFERIPYVNDEEIFYHSYVGIGLEDNGRLIAGCLYSDHKPHNIDMHFASDSPKAATKRNFRAWFGYPFIQLGVQRVTAIIAKPNKSSRAFVEKAGFLLEGTARKGFDGIRDACIYGMLFSDCRYLKTHTDRRQEHGRKRRGRKSTTSTRSSSNSGSTSSNK